MAKILAHVLSIGSRFGLRSTRRAGKQRRLLTSSTLRRAPDSQLPRVAQPSLWTSLVPRAFRRSEAPSETAERARTKAARSKGWDPATAFIVLGLLVGSNAINTIALRNEVLNFSRKTDAKLALLREVVQRVKNDEDVDVERLLGTGDPVQEKEWEEVIKELEETDPLWENKKKRDAKQAGKAGERVASSQTSLNGVEREGGSSDGVTIAEKEGSATRTPKFMM